MNRIRLTVAALITAATAAVSLSGCTSTPATPADSVSAGSNHPAESATPTPAASTPASDGTAPFGTAYTWADGLSVTISKPTAYTPSSSAAGTVDGQSSVVLTVTVVNGTDQPFDLGMASISAQSGNTEASQIYDSAKGLESSPMTKLLAGRESTYKVAFSVTDPKDLVVEFAPDFTHESVLFTS